MMKMTSSIHVGALWCLDRWSSEANSLVSAGDDSDGRKAKPAKKKATKFDSKKTSLKDHFLLNRQAGGVVKCIIETFS
jgi:hypothetical protein